MIVKSEFDVLNISKPFWMFFINYYAKEEHN